MLGIWTKKADNSALVYLLPKIHKAEKETYL